jgi:hypothetical protein
MMTYTLEFQWRIGLWELKINNFRARFFRTRDAAMELVDRYRAALEHCCQDDTYARDGEAWSGGFADNH